MIVDNENGDRTDKYGRELGYVHRNEFDLGEVLLRWGLAKARYDGLDGYDRHPRQDRRIDAVTTDPSCARFQGSKPSPTPTTPGVY